MAATDADTAEKARASGNEFYRAGQLTEAEKAYQIAASLAPQDPAPVSNLSAVRYEMGDYKGAILHVKQSLALSAAGTDGAAKRDNLNARLARCFLCLGDFSAAKDAISAIANPDIGTALSESLESMLNLQASVPDKKKLRSQILDHVPQYKSWLAEVPEYYPAGHDTAEKLTELIAIDATGKNIFDVALLFAGCGDARNVYSAISSMAFCEDDNQRAFKKLHMTMLDLNHASVAKSLILFNMMYQIDNEMDEKGPHPTDYFLAMAYIFACQIIPPFAQARLQNCMDNLIQRLEHKAEPLSFIHLSPLDEKAVVRVLRLWKKPWSAIATPAQMRKLVKRKTRPDALGNGAPSRKEADDPEQKEYKKFTALFPANAVAKQWEPSLGDVLAEYRRTNKGEKLSQQINLTWSVNNTILDYDYADLS